MTKQLNSLQYGNDIYNLRNTYYGTIASANVDNSGLLTINATIDSNTQESEEDTGFPFAVGNILTLFANNAQTNTNTQSIQLRFNNSISYPVYWNENNKPLIWDSNTVLNFMFRKTIQFNNPIYSFIYLGTENKTINSATAQIKQNQPNRREIVLSHDASPTSKTQIASFNIPNYELETNSIPPAPYYTLGTRASSDTSNFAGQYSTSIGYNNTVSGNYSFAEGYANTASGNYSFARGHTTKALGFCSHTEGNNTIATGVSQTVLGKYNLEDKITPTQTIEIDQTQTGLIYKDFTFKVKSSGNDEESETYYSENEITSITLTGEDSQPETTEQYFFYWLNNQQNLWVQTSKDNLSSIVITYKDGATQPLANPMVLDESGDPTEFLDPDWLQKGYYIELNQSFSNQMTITGKRGIEDFSINITNDTIININDVGALMTVDLQTGDVLTIKWLAYVADRYAMIIGNGTANNKRSNALTVDWDGNIETGGAVLEPVGTILPYAGEYEPKGWMFCDGRALLRTEYPSLFSIIGTKYGSAKIHTSDDGFLLPNLNGRTLVGTSSEYELGTFGGEATHTLTIDEMPTHNHATHYYNENGDPNGDGITFSKKYRVSGTTEGGSMIVNRGGNQPHNNMQPYLAVNYIICVKNVNSEIEIPETPPVYSQPLIHMETISNSISMAQGAINSQTYTWTCPTVEGYIPFAITGYRFSGGNHQNRLNVWMNDLTYNTNTAEWVVNFKAWDVENEGVSTTCLIQIAYIRDFTQ